MTVETMSTDPESPTYVTLSTYDAAVIGGALCLLVLLQTASLISGWARSS